MRPDGKNLLRVRFGAVDAELAGIINRVLSLPPEEFTPLLLQLSREELIIPFSINYATDSQGRI
ncbi:hypothetical protein [[Phormidium] sp. ETS-05]|uniref:hypothetical protein n=1 Tax=[Phormidium] sp. ETS-05 TaxID=222819 RepID=UPI0018EF2EA6|nr:hypothetical protein [[Phormidium] sp. ETS-05]